jgi:5-keto-L-gluconate epimerase
MYTNHQKVSLVLSTHQAQFQAVTFKGDLQTNLVKIAGWGYGGVELAIRDPDLVDVSQLENDLKRNALKVSAIGTGQAWGEERLSFSDPDARVRAAAVKRIKHHIELAKRLQALVIIGLIRGRTPTGQEKARSIQYLMEGLQGCANAASAQGVELAIEPINRYETDLINTAAEGLELIDQIGSPNLGLLLDTFHMNIEEPNIIESILKSGKNIRHVHVADSNRWYPGAGHLDFSSIFSALGSVDYAGWISGEFMPFPDSDSAAKNCIAFLKQIIPVE